MSKFKVTQILVKDGRVDGFICNSGGEAAPAWLFGLHGTPVVNMPDEQE